jgi:hypothetical protein
MAWQEHTAAGGVPGDGAAAGAGIEMTAPGFKAEAGLTFSAIGTTVATF